MSDDAAKPALGFIGLGLMGSAMAEMLLAAAHRLAVWNRETEAMQAFEARGAKLCDSPEDVARQAEIIFICVIDTDAVRQVSLGEAGIAAGARPGTVVVDHSTAMPEDTRDIASALAARGIAFVDAPVSGGPAFAREAKLTVMMGGSEADIARVQPLMATYARNLTRMGDVGAGQMTKVINQAISGVSYVLMAEVARLAEESGIDAEKVPDCLAGGHADSVMLGFAYPKMLHRDFEPPGSLASQMLKDLKNVGREAERLGLDLTLVRSAERRFADFVAAGGGRSETASIYRSYRNED